MTTPGTERLAAKEKFIPPALAQHQARLDVLRRAEFRHEALEFGLLFDHRWYASTYLHKECSFGQALAHFLGEGLKNYHDPSLFFSTLYYAGQAEFEKWPVNILEHYVREGAARGLNPCPLFDSPWYYERYEVASSGLTPLAHFVQAARQGVMHDPNEFFDTALYMEEQDVVGGEEYPHPLFHYLQTAFERKQRTSHHFYTDGYRLAYEDVAKSDGNPLEHYLRHGRFEGRNPRALMIEYREDKLRLEEFKNIPADGRLVFYTAVAGDYSRLLPPAALVPGARYVCFSDLPRQTYGIWEIRPLPGSFGESSRWASRWCKLHPRELFPDAEAAVWLDGNVIINGDMEPYIRRVLDSGLPVGMIRHPLRDCVYEEITACIEYKKDDEERLARQKNRYLSLALPEHGGLYETNVVINNLNHPDLPVLYDLWWRELSEQSWRDQVSLPYALHTLRLAPCEFLPEGISARNSGDFIFLSHAATFISTLKGPPFPTEVGFPEQLPGFAAYRAQHPDCFDQVRDIRADVIVAVHNAQAHARACFASLLPTLRGADGLIIVNDASDAETTGWLREFAKSDARVRLLENAQNLGYTGSANRGLQASDAPFRIMLNSDTLVPDNWLERMLMAAYGDEKTGIVGPLSGAASYQSVPYLEFTEGNTPINALPEGKSVADMDMVCASAAPCGLYPAVALVHGFCIGIRQEVIDAIGYFDEVNFAKFFGEENDYCLRAAEAGFTLRIAVNVYVFHAKSKSISEETRKMFLGEAGNALRRIHGPEKIETAIRRTLHNPLLIYMRNTCADFYRAQAEEQKQISGGQKIDTRGTERFSAKARSIPPDLAKHLARLHVLRRAEFRREALEVGLLFDHQWYASKYLRAECSFEQALAHFLSEGLEKLYDPSRFFSTFYYVGQAGFEKWPVNILEHYIREGAARGLNPCFLFDSPWYYERYDVAASGLTPLAHFVQAARRGVLHDPNEFFDTALYMEEQDVVGGEEYPHPLFHYLRNARKHRARTSSRFNTLEYILAYEDVYVSGANPLDHYLRYGRFEGRNPRPLSAVYTEAKLRLKEFQSARPGEKLVFYTAIAGNYSRLLPPAALVPGARYVCFSDLPRQTYGIWEIRPLPKILGDSPSRTNRWCKMHPHELFPDAEIAVYLDGNVIISGDMKPYIRRVLDSGLPVGMIRHPFRDCVYEEITACVGGGKDSAERLQRQKNRYLSLSLPAHAGLYECNFIINNLGHPILPDFYDLWWRELSEQSGRDQVSLPYVLHTMQFAPCEFLPRGKSVRNSEDFFFIVRHADTFDVVLDETLFSV